MAGPVDGAKQSRLKQMRTGLQADPASATPIDPVAAGSFLIPVAIGVALGFVLKPLWLWIPLGVIFGVLVALNIFGRRAQRTAFTEMEGQPGAGASVVQRMRGDFRVTTPVQVNRNQDLSAASSRRAGVILIAEGRGRGARDLLGAEVRRVKRVIGDDAAARHHRR